MKRNYFNCETKGKGGLIVGGSLGAIVGIALGVVWDSNYFYLLFGLMGVLLCGMGVRGLFSEKSYERYLTKKDGTE